MYYHEDDRAQRLFDVLDVLDGQVNVQDIVELISVITSQEQSNIDLLVQDVNQDGFVNVIDVIEIINQIIGEN